MLHLGEILEEWTHKKSVADLASAMSLRVDSVWQQVNGAEVLTKITDVKPGDRIVIRTGGMIPLDGRVVEGEAMVNQSSLTGESMPVAKHPGSPVYAGTVAEEGECVISVEKSSGSGRYDRVVHMIEESEKLKSTAEDKASRMADRLVPAKSPVQRCCRTGSSGYSSVVSRFQAPPAELVLLVLALYLFDC